MTFETPSTNGNGAILLPINAVKIISEEEGEISLLTASGILEKKSVKLGNVGEANIQIF